MPTSHFSFIMQRFNWRMWNILNIWVACQQMMEDVHVKLNPGLLCQMRFQQEGDFSPAN